MCVWKSLGRQVTRKIAKTINSQQWDFAKYKNSAVRLRLFLYLYLLLSLWSSNKPSNIACVRTVVRKGSTCFHLCELHMGLPSMLACPKEQRG